MAGNAARLAVLATVGVWLIRRVPGNISVTDVLVALAGLALSPQESDARWTRHARLVLRAFAFYLATLLLTLAFNQNLERISSGSTASRWSPAQSSSARGSSRSDLHHRALQLLLAVTVGFSVLAVLNTASRGFAPAQPLGYQKNFIGSLMATVLLVLVAAHREFELPRRVLVFAGLVVASDSSPANRAERWSRRRRAF